MNNQFSPNVSQILAFSREEAARLESTTVGPEHLLLGILRNKNGAVRQMLDIYGIDIRTIKGELEQKIREDTHKYDVIYHELVLNEKASNILKLAVLEARMQARTSIEEQHLLLAILHDQVGNGAKTVLEMNNMNYEDAVKYFSKNKENIRTTNGIGLSDEDDDDDVKDATGENAQEGGLQKGGTTTTRTRRGDGKTPVLDNFSTDLTKAAAEGVLDPVVGRENEIQRVIEILGRRPA